jgi:hypothetical protein
MRYKYKNLTQTQLGKLFGVSSHVVGEWLVKRGLRDSKTKRPTAEAHRNGYCETAPSGPTGYHWAWDAQRTVAALTSAGHALVDDLPDDLVHPPAMTGPFTAKDRAVQNATGETVFRATAGAEHAGAIVKLLNAAHRHGMLAKLVRAGDEVS